MKNKPFTHKSDHIFFEGKRFYTKEVWNEDQTSSIVSYMNYAYAKAMTDVEKKAGDLLTKFGV
jgi:hypothetical protein